MSDDDAKQLAELSQQLTAIDLDPAHAERIAHRVRRDIGHGPSPRRFVEPILVALFTGSILVWAAIKVLEAFR